MNVQQLFASFERIVDSPDSVAKLRRLVLSLAVRGKLLPQDPSDEPAIGLLGGEQRRDAAARYGDEQHSSPMGWIAVRAGSLISLTKGRKPARLNQEGAGLPYLDIAALEGSRARQFSDDSKCPVASVGDLIVVCDGSRSGLLLEGRTGILGSTLAILRYSGFCRDYLRVLFNALYEDLNTAKKGAAIPHLNIPRLLSKTLQLPPISEQHRIVVKVDELMALCDRLEAARAEREAARDRLTAASLSRLNTPDLETLLDDARFALDALSALTVRPDQIKLLRQAILSLAVRGKLVRQEATDEVASKLLEHIAVENTRLRDGKGLRPQKLALPVANLESDVTLPGSWQSVYLQDISYQITDGTHLTPSYTESGRPFLSAQNVKPFKFMPARHRFVSQEHFDAYRANRRPERGDVLMTRVGAGIGEAAVLDSDLEFAFYVSLCLIKIPTELVSPDYLALWLNSPDGRESSRLRTYGKEASQGNLNLGLIRTFKVPLPPTAEQIRIVEQVNRLWSICDGIEASLSARDNCRTQLLEAVLHDALESAEVLEEAA